MGTGMSLCVWLRNLPKYYVYMFHIWMVVYCYFLVSFDFNQIKCGNEKNIRT